MKKKITFALYFGNRGFFPGESIADARTELAQAVKDTQTVYYQTDESLESGYPDDSYEETAAILKITEFGSMLWYSIVLMVAGVLTGAGLLVWVIVSKKRKNQKN